MQLPLFVPQSNWRPPIVSQLPSWKGAKRIGIDTETSDPHLRELGPGFRRGAYVAGISFSIEDGPKYYVPLRHGGGDNVESPEQALLYFRHQAKEFDGEIVGANLGYDLDALGSDKIFFPNIKRFRDVQVIEAIIDELQLSYSLETISNKYLGIGKSEGILREAANAYGVDAKKELAFLAARFVGPYAVEDADLPLKVLRRQEKIIDDEDLWKVHDLECDLIPVLVKMRQRGIRIDQDQLDKVEAWSTLQEKEALERVHSITGIRIPLNCVWQASVLAPALEYVGVKVPITPKTKKPSIDKNFLKSIKHPVAEALERARKVNKVRSTFVASVRRHMTNGRIHCTINQGRRTDDEDDPDDEGKGARYGRCSSDHPNLQQQPAKDPEIGPMWRSIYIADEGKLLASGDFSTQEPRQALHYAATTALGFVRIRTENGWEKVNADKSARDMLVRYQNDPTTDNHQMFADIIHERTASSKERKHAKDLFLGKCYGMGGAKLCKSLGLPTIMAVYDPLTHRSIDANSEEGRRLVSSGRMIFEAAGTEGQRIIDQFDLKVPWVKAISKICEESAKTRGYVRTLGGRRCRFKKDDFGNWMDTHKSLNRIVQGGSADQTKRAMIEVDKAGYQIILQVHDELLSLVNDSREAESIASIMRDCFPLAVPSKVDVACVANWGEVK